MEHPLNYLNQLFYSGCPEAFTTSGLADFFVSAPAVQEAIYQHLSSLFPNQPIRLKEICAGARPDRWDYLFSRHPGLNWDITLSDFSPSALPGKYRTQVENLFDPISALPEKEKCHVILATYGFDSLWFPSDAHYQKTNGVWSKTMLGLPQHLSGSSSLSELAAFIPTINTQPIDIKKEPYGKQIEAYYQDSDNISFNFPGGLIEYAKNIFPLQLAPSGVFLSGDVAYSGSNPQQLPYETIGQVAKFHSSDYGLAQLILKQLGFHVELYSLNDFLEKYTLSFPLDLSDHLFMQVSLPTK